MNSTIKLPSAVLKLAEQAARARSIPVTDFLTEAVQNTARRPWMKTPWMKTAGNLADLHEENKRIKALITEEFRTLNEEAPAHDH